MTKAQTLHSLDLALRMLDALGPGGGQRGVTDLALEFGVSKATVYRSLATLERRGWVVQDAATSRYAVGPHLRQFSQLALGQIDLAREAHPYMETLRERTEDSVHLAVLEREEVVYIARLEGLHPVEVISSIGTRCPAHCTSPGKALLAYADPNVLAGLIHQGLTAYTPRTHANADALETELGKVRQRGYAVNWGEWRDSVRGIAAPVRDGSGRVAAALAICAPAFRLTRRRVSATAPMVTGAAAELSAALGTTEASWAVGSRAGRE